MSLDYNIIILLIIIIVVLITIIRNKNKEVKKYRKDWEFCRKLLPKERKRIKEIVYQNTQQKKKQENKNKIMDLLKQRGRVGNDEVEKLLGVSDATATRYLDELEKQGKIKQVGKRGRFVYYEPM